MPRFAPKEVRLVDKRSGHAALEVQSSDGFQRKCHLQGLGNGKFRDPFEMESIWPFVLFKIGESSLPPGVTRVNGVLQAMVRTTIHAPPLLGMQPWPSMRDSTAPSPKALIGRRGCGDVVLVSGGQATRPPVQISTTMKQNANPFRKTPKWIRKPCTVGCGFTAFAIYSLWVSGFVSQTRPCFS